VPDSALRVIGAIEAAGYEAWVVGGWVRDFLRQVPAHDKDYMVAGIDEEKFQQVFPKAPRVGKAFPVYLVEIDGHHAEVAFARKEEKKGAGYRGFVVEYGREVTLEEDLYRRDTTINSMAM
jgi:tRNA nucleotidyltransferase (CCA-adding enzyme)